MFTHSMVISFLDNFQERKVNELGYIAGPGDGFRGLGGTFF